MRLAIIVSSLSLLGFGFVVAGAAAQEETVVEVYKSPT